jgi:hypothetical protein
VSKGAGIKEVGADEVAKNKMGRILAGKEHSNYLKLPV